jgi:hypothetical protein
LATGRGVQLSLLPLLDRLPLAVSIRPALLLVLIGAVTGGLGWVAAGLVNRAVWGAPPGGDGSVVVADVVPDVGQLTGRFETQQEGKGDDPTATRWRRGSP